MRLRVRHLTGSSGSPRFAPARTAQGFGPAASVGVTVMFAARELELSGSTPTEALSEAAFETDRSPGPAGHLAC